jgi:hypothetical protein
MRSNEEWERGSLTRRLVADLPVGDLAPAKSVLGALRMPGGERENVRQRIASIPLNCNNFVAKMAPA